MNDKRVFVYLVKDNYTYKNNVGKIENVEMAFEIKSEFRGKNQTPFDGSLKEHSPNENVIHYDNKARELLGEPK